jgi:uncharacterized protein with GYD domain
MPIYITLYKFTEQGIKDIKNAPSRVEQGIKGWEAMGGKMLGFYATLGEYDYVGIAESPDEETATAYLLKTGSLGNVKTTTLKAFTVEEFKKIVSKIP